MPVLTWTQLLTVDIYGGYQRLHGPAETLCSYNQSLR